MAPATFPTRQCGGRSQSMILHRSPPSQKRYLSWVSRKVDDFGLLATRSGRHPELRRPVVVVRPSFSPKVRESPCHVSRSKHQHNCERKSGDYRPGRVAPCRIGQQLVDGSSEDHSATEVLDSASFAWSRRTNRRNCPSNDRGSSRNQGVGEHLPKRGRHGGSTGP